MLTRRILVTGGAGFIGSHLCDRLLADGHEVICLDNFFTGHRRNIRHLIGQDRFEVIRHDIITPIDIECDQIYNLACPASPRHYQFNPVRTIQANVLGVTNLLELARRTQARILQASTSEVYGDPSVHPQPESYRGNVNHYGARGCYDEGKRIAETLLWCYSSQHLVDTRIARIFNTYGPRLSFGDGRVISNFILQALDGRSMTVFGSGQQTRAFCYITDLVDGLMRLMESATNPGPVNLGNPRERTILEIAELIRTLCGGASPIVHDRLPDDDPVRRCPDIQYAIHALNWRPKVDLQAGLLLTIDYFRRQKDEPE